MCCTHAKCGVTYSVVDQPNEQRPAWVKARARTCAKTLQNLCEHATHHQTQEHTNTPRHSCPIHPEGPDLQECTHGLVDQRSPKQRYKKTSAGAESSSHSHSSDSKVTPCAAHRPSDQPHSGSMLTTPTRKQFHAQPSYHPISRGVTASIRQLVATPVHSSQRNKSVHGAAWLWQQ
jgi:hypothetical protein